MDLEERVERYNKDLVKSTRSRRPLMLVYQEYFSPLAEARKKRMDLKIYPVGW
jgi:predicted GIY-YIG superfamily endonuclease